MAFKRLRGSVLLLMILVVISAVVFALIKAGSEYRQTRERYLSLAKWHAKCWQGRATIRKKNRPQPFRDYDIAEEQYHRDLEAKYLRAAARPWIALEPDPPSPKYPVKDIMKELKQQMRGLNAPSPRKEDPVPKSPEPDFI